MSHPPRGRRHVVDEYNDSHRQPDTVPTPYCTTPPESIELRPTTASLLPGPNPSPYVTKHASTRQYTPPSRISQMYTLNLHNRASPSPSLQTPLTNLHI